MITYRFVTMPDQPPIVPDCRDAKDVSLLWLAVVGQAAYLVTGDQDLLVLVDEFSVPIVTAAEFGRTFRIGNA